MGFFKDLGNSISKGLGSGIAGAAIGGISSLFGASSRAKAEQRAADLQFQNWQKTYNIQRKDALSDYIRNLHDQRELIKDQASLQKLGLEKAGINPANQDGAMSLGGASVQDVLSSDGSYNPVNQYGFFGAMSDAMNNTISCKHLSNAFKHVQ